MTTRLLKSSENINGLPIGFQEVEYLESSGTEYIDTGVLGSNKARMEIVCQGLQSNRAVAGCGESDDRLQIYAGATYYSVRIDGSAETSTTLSLNKAQIILDAVNKKADVNGTVYSLPYTGTIASVNIHLFRVNRTAVPPSDTTYNFIGKIWQFKLYDNNTLVRDFIPALNPAGRPCMYDLIGKKAYYNLGSGEFTYGRKIIPVEYLESTGTQYINTGYVLSSDCRGEALAEYTGVPSSGSSYIFGTFGGNKNFGVNTSLHSPGQDTLFYFVWANVARVDVTGDPLPALNTKYHVTVSRTLMKVNNSSFTYDGATFTGSNPAYLFWANGTSQPKSIMKLYWTKFWDGHGNLVRDYISCIDENNTPYMFDKITHTCYLNAGTGTFSYGKKLYSSKIRLYKDPGARFGDILPKGFKRVEYLESTGTQYIDTGLKGNLNTKIEAKVYSAKISSDSGYCIAGDFTTSTKAITMPFNFVSDGLYSRFGDKYITTGIQQQDGTYTFAVDKAGYYVNGTKIANFNTTTSFTTDNNLMLFGFTGLGRNYLVGKIYYCKIWNDTTLVANFIPALDTTNTPCMYDTVTQTAFYNQGTGQFTYGVIIPNKVRLIKDV